MPQAEQAITTQETETLARVLVGLPVLDVEIGSLRPELWEIAERMAGHEVAARVAVFDRETARLPDGEHVWYAVLTAGVDDDDGGDDEDPLDADDGGDDEDAPGVSADAPVVDEGEPAVSMDTPVVDVVDEGPVDLVPGCPALPAAARIDPALGTGVGGVVDDYVAYAGARSPMTPGLFHLSAILWLLSVLVARRLVLPMAFGDIYPNIWVIWIAPTTLFHKSTAMNIVHGIALRHVPHLLLPPQITPEALFSDLAGCEPTNFDKMTREEQERWREERNFAAQRGLMVDEVSGFLNGAGRDYMAGLLEQLLLLHDCAPCLTRSTRGQGRLTIENAYLSMLAATTPDGAREHLRRPHLWRNGWAARHALLTPAVERPPYRRAPDIVPEPVSLGHDLDRLYQRLPMPTWPDPPTAITVTLGPGVREAWERYDEAVTYDLLTLVDERLRGTYGRLPTQALKVAMLLAAVDWAAAAGSPCIELPHLARAIAIVEEWRASAHRALALTTREASSPLRERLLGVLERAGTRGETTRDLGRLMRGVDRGEVETMLGRLVRDREVESIEQPSGPKGGKPTTRFRITSS